MPLFDLPLAELHEYRPSLRRPDDFDAFWTDTLAEARAAAWSARTTRVDTGLRLVETWDLEFSGYGGHPIRAWVHVPGGASGPLPTVVQFHGYSGGRGLPWQDHTYAEAGHVQIVMDARGQGWTTLNDTSDPAAEAGQTTIPGVMTRGIRDPHDYYYRRVFTDAAMLVDAARTLPWVDPARVAVAGISQGGGIAIAAAALSEGLAGALVDVPFLCHFERALEITDGMPYAEILTYLSKYRDRADEVARTLSYVDGANLAARADAPVLFSTGLRDITCPPSTVFAAYNAWGGDDRDIVVYPYNAHEGGGEHHVPLRLAFLERVFGA
ncbi:acetylxylan esterase [Microbacterium radiodurans]|uniref:Acetylxylan esterase n=1 Tax=Microbacterium radiodurans TaxID=661398 RepID=A0A5J5IXT1_9MICO|nr:acetylxylan esterase [Microbacterium radiodurans]KAA9089622.1 acetylxylan esterase [Microbacterium radiodurans]